ncbi:MAG: hypothetical protein KKB21_00740 [Nanoarchaeota archaeon]|nr:hypothetical protein [Nanoarchaeota archaeon]MBU4086082.1 hypothetical protein [Nanoarchaeota archaeon]
MVNWVITELFLNPFRIVVFLLFLFIIVMIILTVIEIRQKRIIERQKKTKESSFVTQLKELSDSKQPLKEKLDLINQVAKNFFNEYYNIPLSADYSELVEDFKKRNKPKISEFCDLMLSVYYSGKSINEERVDILIKVLLSIIQEASTKQAIRPLPLEPLQNQKSSLLSTNPKEDSSQIPNHHKSKFERYIEIASDCRRELEKLARELKANKNIIELAKKDKKNKEEILKMLSEHPQEFSQLKEAEKLIKKNHLALNSLIKRIHEDFPHNHKKEINNLAKAWHKKNKVIFSKIKNPFKQYMQELDLLIEFFIKLGLIITKLKLQKK